MFNASSSKFNSSNRGTLHVTRQPRSCEVAPALRQFHFQTSISNTSDSSSSLLHFRCSSSHLVPNGMKLMAISKICVSAYKYNKSNKIKKIDASQAAKSLAEKIVLLPCKLRKPELSPHGQRKSLPSSGSDHLVLEMISMSHDVQVVVS